MFHNHILSLLCLSINYYLLGNNLELTIWCQGSPLVAATSIDRSPAAIRPLLVQTATGSGMQPLGHILLILSSVLLLLLLMLLRGGNAVGAAIAQ